MGRTRAGVKIRTVPIRGEAATINNQTVMQRDFVPLQSHCLTASL
jgi:hypothetical protein